MWDGRMIPQTAVCELPYKSSVCWLCAGTSRIAAVLTGDGSTIQHQSRSTALSRHIRV